MLRSTPLLSLVSGSALLVLGHPCIFIENVDKTSICFRSFELYLRQCGEYCLQVIEIVFRQWVRQPYHHYDHTQYKSTRTSSATRNLNGQYYHYRLPASQLHSFVPVSLTAFTCKITSLSHLHHISSLSLQNPFHPNFPQSQKDTLQRVQAQVRIPEHQRITPILFICYRIPRHVRPSA